MADADPQAAQQPARLLLVDPAGGLEARLAPALADEFRVPPAVLAATTGRRALDLLRGGAVDLVVADLDALADLGSAGEDRIGRLVRAAAGALIVILSDDPGISVALAAMRAGAHECAGRQLQGRDLTRLIGELAVRHNKLRCLTRSAPPAPAAPEPAAIPDMRDLVLPMWRQEQRIIEQAIESFAGNIALAAQALELSPSTIYRKRQAWAGMDGKRGAA